MRAVVWKSPVPSSAYLSGVEIELKPRRKISIVFDFENESGVVRGGIHFRDVVCYRTTYLYAIRAEAFQQAYDRVVDMDDSPELLDLREAMRANGRPADVRHYRVCFDDGPCFDFFAGAFEE